jgi:tetratricopeptide (TPR) repeat protein
MTKYFLKNNSVLGAFFLVSTLMLLCSVNIVGCQKKHPTQVTPYHYIQAFNEQFDQGGEAHVRRWMEIDRMYHPNEAYSFLGNGSLSMQGEKFDEAITWFQKGIAARPDMFCNYYGVGFALFQNGQIDTSLDWFQKRVQEEPRDAACFFGLGQVYNHQGKYAEAKDSFARSLALDPTNIDAYIEMSETYGYMGDHMSAIEILKKARVYGPLHGELFYEIGNHYRKLGETDKAQNEYLSGVKVDPRDPQNYFGIAELYAAQHKYDEAITWFNKSLSYADDTYTCPYSGLGMAYLNKAEPVLAESNFILAIDHAPNAFWVRYHLAKFYFDVGKDERANELLQEILNGPMAFSEREHALELKGVFAALKFDYESAADAFSEIADTYGRFGAVHLLEGLQALRQKDYVKAQSLFAQVQAGTTKGLIYESALIGNAECLLMNASHEEALFLYKEVLRTSPINVVALKGAVRMCNLLGDFDAAGDYAERLKRVEPMQSSIKV